MYGNIGARSLDRDLTLECDARVAAHAMRYEQNATVLFSAVPILPRARNVVEARAEQ